MPPAVIPTTEPLDAIAGDTWRWDRTVADYLPSAGWTLKYAFRGVSVLNVTAAPNAAQSGYEVTVTTAQSLTLIAGVYEWRAWVEQAGERFTIDRGVLTVQADLATTAAGILQPSAEVMLPLLEAEIKARITGVGSGHEQYMIGIRSITKIPLSELLEIRNAYRTELRRKRNGGRLPPIGLRFVRPS